MLVRREHGAITAAVACQNDDASTLRTDCQQDVWPGPWRATLFGVRTHVWGAFHAQYKSVVRAARAAHHGSLAPEQSVRDNLRQTAISPGVSKARV